MITHLNPYKDLPNAASTGDATITPGSTPTWSGWTQLIASTSFVTSHVLISFYATMGTFGGGGRDFFEIQIASGGAGSEVNLFGSHTFEINASQDCSNTDTVFMTKEIAASTRISVRSRGSGSSISLRTVLTVLGR